MNPERIAVYPGTFDPITKGHINVIRRSLLICDKLIIAVADDVPKTPIFSVEERAGMVQADVDHENLSNRVEVLAFSGLLMRFAKENKAQMLIRGLRAVSDFEYEFQLATMNSRLEPDIQTVFLPASDNHQFLASKLVKEVARLGGDISPFVSEHVAEKLHGYYS